MSGSNSKGWALAAGLLLAVSARAGTGDLGKIDFPTSGKPAAQQHFLRGALLLHSFEYDDAAEEFREAQKLDPSFAMAYWGEAETQNHPLWMEQDRDAALAILKRLAPTPEARLRQAPTEREKGYLSAVEALYAEGDKPARDRAYAEAMRQLHERFPEDLEAASLYALALLGTCEGKRDPAVYMTAAAILEDVFAENRLHPGAVHYLIHCYDDPIHAPLGMRAARVYARIAPAAGHALHMPSHIFFASGMWEEAAASNTAAWKASLDRAERKSLGPDDHNDHALLWLEYAQLQLGQYAAARQTLATMEADAGKSGSKRTRSHLTMMKAAYVIETRRWNGDAARIAVETDDLSQRGLSLFVEGLLAIEIGNSTDARATLSRMRSPSEKAPAQDHAAMRGMSYSAGGSGKGADSILGDELEAKILFARGDREKALTLAKEAAANEDAMSFDFGPPAVAKPAHELLGEMLLACDRPAEAKKEFQASLSRGPGRSLSLLGLARAAAKSGDAEASRRASTDLARNWRRADPDLPERSEIRPAAIAGAGK